MDKIDLHRLTKLEHAVSCLVKDIAHIKKTCCSSSVDGFFVSAGDDISINFPSTTSATLNGIATSTVSTIISTVWSLVNGPNSPTFSSTTVLRPVVSGLIAGSYTFRLTVTDSRAIVRTDEVTLSVNSIPTFVYFSGWSTTDPLPALQVADNFTYQNTATAVNNSSLICDFRSAPANQFFVVKYPVSQQTKVGWVNTALNSGIIPDSLFRAEFVNNGFRYIVSRQAISMDSSSQTTFY